MTKRMLIDATHPEETRVAVVNGTRVEEFDYETEFRKQLKGNIYLAKVTRVEPSLQAAFVEYGGNRHAFLPFPEIHSDYYRIPIGDRPHSEDYDDHGHDADVDRPLPVGALSGESAAAHNEQFGDEISEAFETVRQAYDNQPSQSEVDEYHLRDEEEFSEADDSVQPRSLDDDVPTESHVESGHDESEHAEAVHDEQAAEHPVAGEPPHGGSVETVGGDEVDEIRHRRRTQMPRYKIQEVIKRRQIMLIQVSKEERGNKGAAVTTFLSLPGRYCVLMPNTPRGGGVSRKIANPTDRRRMKELIGDLELPPGMSVILRTAGVERTKTEIKRDLDYLMRLWEAIRDLTLRSTAPALVYEEGNLIKRAIRDIYGKDISDIQVAGETGYRQAKDFMRMLMPSHARRVQLYRDPVPLFFRFQVESQIDAMHNPVAQLRSGGYIVINQTEALVSIDVNSGRSTRERNIEETAYKTNLEAADEIARQLRLRDMGGLIVIDFIDMEDPRHDSAVERRLKEAMKNDRARIQIGRVSAFGLLELSRQRLHPSLIESNFHTCAACRGTGIVRSLESAAFVALRAIEEEGIKAKAAEMNFAVHPEVALYILNHKRRNLVELEERYALGVTIEADGSLISPDYRIERLRAHPPGFVPPIMAQPLPPLDLEEDEPEEDEGEEQEYAETGEGDGGDQQNGRRRRRRRGRRRGGADEAGSSEGFEGSAQENESAFGSGHDDEGDSSEPSADQPDFTYPPETIETGAAGSGVDRAGRRRRGRRGGRRRHGAETGTDATGTDTGAESEAGEYDAFAETSSEQEHRQEPSDAEASSDPFSPSYHIAETPLPEPAMAEPAGVEDLVSAPLSVRQSRASSRRPAKSEAWEPALAETDQSAEAELEARPAEPLTAPKRDYEVVNQEPETPRQGWWKRLIQ